MFLKFLHKYKIMDTKSITYIKTWFVYHIPTKICDRIYVAKFPVKKFKTQQTKEELECKRTEEPVCSAVYAAKVTGNSDHLKKKTVLIQTVTKESKIL